MPEARILVIDDDRSQLRVLEHFLAESGFEVIAASSAQEGLLRQAETPAEVIVTDLNMPGLDGIGFIRALRERDANTSIILVTGFPTIDAAVEAMRAGAFDFIQKPVESKHLAEVVRKALEHARLARENRELKNLVEDHLDFGQLIGRSPGMLNIYKQARQVSASNVTVLIQGETGTGKELLAKAIHHNSPRKDGAFVVVNCAAVPGNLLESELFGHVKGAFTGAISDRRGRIEDANGGTLFLDEVGDLPLDLQPKLLRVLQEKEITPVGSNQMRKVDVRFVAATHRDLHKMVGEGTFREDLFFRLNVVPLLIPPLRQRREDIVLLFHHFLKEAAREEGRSTPTVEPAVVTPLEANEWPGNVRELQNLAQRIIALNPVDVIGLANLPEPYNKTSIQAPGTIALTGVSFDLEEWTDRVILAALEKYDWNQSQTAKYLGISRNTMAYRLDNRPILREAKAKRVQGAH